MHHQRSNHTSRRLSIALAMGLSISLSSPALAQQPADEPVSPDPRSVFQIDRLIDAQVAGLADRYKLDQSQQDHARQLIKQHADNLLARHGPVFQQLTADYIRLRITGRQPDAEQAKKWAQLIEPLYADAKSAISEGTTAFRNVLNDSQKQLHDADIAQLNTTYALLDQKIDRWKVGQFDPAEWNALVAPAPARPQPNPPQTNQRPEVRPEQLWQSYVRNYAREHDFSPEQEKQAADMLAKAISEAQRLGKEIEEKIDDIDRRIAEARRGQGERDLLTDLYRQRRDLLLPLMQQFATLKTQLDTLPTPEQKDAYEQRMAVRAARFNRMKADRNADDEWVLYVRLFIERHKLEPPQIESAESILKELRQRYANWRAAHQVELDQITERVEQLTSKPGEQGADLSKLQQRRGELDLEVEAMYTELKTRLDRLLTPQQRARIGRPAASQPAASQPARTQPTTTQPAP